MLSDFKNDQEGCIYKDSVANSKYCNDADRTIINEKLQLIQRSARYKLAEEYIEAFVHKMVDEEASNENLVNMKVNEMTISNTSLENSKDYLRPLKKARSAYELRNDDDKIAANYISSDIRINGIATWNSIYVQKWLMDNDFIDNANSFNDFLDYYFKRSGIIHSQPDSKKKIIYFHTMNYATNSKEDKLRKLLSKYVKDIIKHLKTIFPGCDFKEEIETASIIIDLLPITHQPLHIDEPVSPDVGWDDCGNISVIVPLHKNVSLYFCHTCFIMKHLQV